MHNPISRNPTPRFKVLKNFAVPAVRAFGLLWAYDALYCVLRAFRVLGVILYYWTETHAERNTSRKNFFKENEKKFKKVLTSKNIYDILYSSVRQEQKILKEI